MATAEGRKRLMASCNCALAVALCERKREASKQELAQQNPPSPSASARFFQHKHHGRKMGPPAAPTPRGIGV